MQTTRTLATAAVIAAAGLAGAAPSAGASGVVNDLCPPEAEGAVCGHVDVPLDRAHPAAGTLAIAFEVYRHSAPGPAESAIVANFGGPGLTTTGQRGYALALFGGLLDRHDLLLIDDRGRGRSGAIDCPALQHATAPQLDAIQACADQLGAAAQRYGSGDIAQDVEAVRAALGYDQLDYVGLSYGGADATAYATRYAEHVRSLVFDAPWGPPYRDVLPGVAFRVQAGMRRAGLVCERSPSCSEVQRDPIERVAQLVRQLRRAPLHATAPDADGRPHTMTVDPQFFLLHVLDNRGRLFAVTGELAAAAEAIRHGDAAPLLRLAAEGDFAPGDSGDPAFVSVGAEAATFCVDNTHLWSPGAPLSVRRAQWDAAVRAAPDRPYAPFRAEEALNGFGDPDFCLPWPGPTTASPMVEPGAPYPNVPTLVLDGDLDTTVPLEPSRRLADLFPGSRFIPVAGAGHTSLGYGDCAARIAAEMIATLRVTDASCAATSSRTWPAVGRFARTAAESPPATATSRHADPLDLRVLRVASDTALDVLKQSFQTSNGDGPGLRGGRFHTDFSQDPVLTYALTGVRLAADVTVSGTLAWQADDTLEGDLTIDGPGRRDGTVHLHGSWLPSNPAQPFTLTATLHGRTLSATAPSA